MIPNNQYTELERKLQNLKLDNFKVFKYNPDPKILTGEIEKLQIIARKKLRIRKMFEDKEDEHSKIALSRLGRSTLRDAILTLLLLLILVIFKNILTSLAFTDVNQEKVLFTTVNQWFDESIFCEHY